MTHVGRKTKGKEGRSGTKRGNCGEVVFFIFPRDNYGDEAMWRGGGGRLINMKLSLIKMRNEVD